MNRLTKIHQSVPVSVLPLFIICSSRASAKNTKTCYFPPPQVASLSEVQCQIANQTTEMRRVAVWSSERERENLYVKIKTRLFSCFATSHQSIFIFLLHSCMHMGAHGPLSGRGGAREFTYEKMYTWPTQRRRLMLYILHLALRNLCLNYRKRDRQGQTSSSSSIYSLFFSPSPFSLSSFPSAT